MAWGRRAPRESQEGEVDDLLAVTQSSSGGLPPQYVALQEAEINIY